MKTIPVLVLLACIASDLCNACNINVNVVKARCKGKGNPEACARKLARKLKEDGEDYGLIGDALADPGLLKALIPKNLGELFDLAEEIVPGMKGLQAPVQETWKLLHPVLKVNLIAFGIIIIQPKNNIFQELPAVERKLAPTLIEIRKALQGDDEISDRQFAKWGKALVKHGRPFAK